MNPYFYGYCYFLGLKKLAQSQILWDFGLTPSSPRQAVWLVVEFNV